MRDFEERLKRLGAAERAAFAAACAERLLPNYSVFADEVGWGDTRLLRDALDRVWRHLDGGGPLSPTEAASLRPRIEAVIPDTEHFATPLVSCALDAGAAVLESVLACVDPDPRHAVDCGALAFDSVDLHVQELLGLAADDPGLEAKIASHPLMVRERARQLRDLEELAAAGTLDHATLGALRARSWNDGVGSLGLPYRAPGRV